MRRIQVTLLVGAVGLAAVGAAAALAGPGGSPGAPILHEDLPSPHPGGRRGQTRAVDPPALLGDAPGPGQNPSAINIGEKILPPPEAQGGGDTTSGGKEPVMGRREFGADRETESRPDTSTHADGTLHYTEPFNPSVVPFKRMSAFDAVRPDYTLVVSQPQARADVPVTGRPTPGWDRFWGSLLVELTPGASVAIPSVAPGMRVVSYEALPRTQLSFSRDPADNFYVRSDEPGVHGVHRLVFLVEADPRYFAPVIPHGIRVSDLPRDKVAPLPPAIQVMGRRALDVLHLSRSAQLDQALPVLVSYFRQFQPGPAPVASGSGVYWDLFVSQTGVCRHRSFAFMITANALGIPTRFVANEAHAWVESWVPKSGWIRIDLGGAASELQVNGASGKAMYRPRGQDPFPKPPAYADNYTRLTGDVTGLTPDQIAEAQRPRPGPDASGGTGGGGGGGGGGGTVSSDFSTGGGDASGDGGDQGDDGHGGDEGDDDGGGDGAALGPGHGLPAIPPSALRGKRPSSIRVNQVSPTGFRGETISISGAVSSGGQGLAGQEVDLYLAPVGRGGDGARLIGHALTRPDGGFTADVTIPYDVSLDEHEVYAATPGDSTHQPSLSH